MRWTPMNIYIFSGGTLIDPKKVAHGFLGWTSGAQPWAPNNQIVDLHAGPRIGGQRSS